MFKTIVAVGMVIFVIEAMNLVSGGEFYVASLRSLAQESEMFQQVHPTEETPIIREGNNGDEQDPMHEQDFIDPQEVKNTLREIKDVQSQFRRFAAQLKKLKNNTDESVKVATVLAELDAHKKIISDASLSPFELREAMQEFRDQNYWDEVDRLRAKLELPKEIKQINISLKRVEKLVKQKSFANLGLNLDKVAISIAEMKEAIAAVQAHLDSGEVEEAMEAMQFFHDDGGHPGEIEGTLHRIRDMKKRIKKIRDEAIRAELNAVLQDVIETFNEGNYRDARETLDEYADELMSLLDKFARASKKSLQSEDSFSKIRNLEQLINSKLDTMEDRRQSPESAESR